MRINLISSFLLLSTNTVVVIRIDAFSILPCLGTNVHSLQSTKSSRTHKENIFALSASSDEHYEDEEEFVTKEMFLRDMLADPESAGITKGEESTSSDAKVRRKKRNGTHFRTLDNRDSLPFLVKVSTPDPYTSNEQMKKDAKLNTKLAKSKTSKNGKNSDGNKKRQNLVGMDGRDSITSSIYTRGDDGDMHKVVGEFALDKSTNCGDIIEVGDGTEYQVQKSRCQYKYAGGKRFVMTRKVLEVKEVKRILVEKEIKELFQKEIGEDEIPGNDGLMLE